MNTDKTKRIQKNVFDSSFLFLSVFICVHLWLILLSRQPLMSRLPKFPRKQRIAEDSHDGRRDAALARVDQESLAFVFRERRGRLVGYDDRLICPPSRPNRIGRDGLTTRNDHEIRRMDDIRIIRHGSPGQERDDFLELEIPRIGRQRLAEGAIADEDDPGLRIMP